MLITVKFNDGEKKYFDDCSEPVINKSNFMIINNLKDDLELAVNLNHVEYFILDRSKNDEE